MENVSLHAPTPMLGTSQRLAFVPLTDTTPSARWAYAANVMDKDLGIIAVGAISLYHIL
jgi:hypothetical protein